MTILTAPQRNFSFHLEVPAGTEVKNCTKFQVQNFEKRVEGILMGIVSRNKMQTSSRNGNGQGPRFEKATGFINSNRA